MAKVAKPLAGKTALAVLRQVKASQSGASFL
jgi:hypothetical protein